MAIIGKGPSSWQVTIQWPLCDLKEMYLQVPVELYD